MRPCAVPTVTLRYQPGVSHGHRDAYISDEARPADAFLDLFRAQSMPAHAKLGMPILGPFLSLEDPDVFFFMRGFPDLDRATASRRASTKAIVEAELEAILMPMLDKYEVVLVDDAEGLVQWGR